jgi:hypothetical protein
MSESIKVVVEQRGAHAHARIFMGPDRDHRALLGTLVGDAEQIAMLVDMLELGVLQMHADVGLDVTGLTGDDRARRHRRSRPVPRRQRRGTVSGDIYIDEWCWLDVDERESYGDAGPVTLRADERWTSLHGLGRGGPSHCGPCMPWAQWVALAREIVRVHGDEPVSVYRGEAPEPVRASVGYITAGSRLAVSREADGSWRGVSPRNGRFASCEGTLAEWVQLARWILSQTAEPS